MDDALTAHGAAALGALGAVLVLTGRTRFLLLAGYVSLGLSQAGLALSLSGGLGGSLGATAFAAGFGGLVVVGGLAAVLAVRPELVLPALLLAAPFRLPLDVDRSHRFLLAVAQSGELGRLIPLYVVLTAAVLASVWHALRGQEPARLPPALAWPAALFLAFASLSLLWTQELNTATNVLLFFLNPFAALLAVSARAPFPRWMPKALGAIAIGLACLFSAVGLWQAATGKVLFYSPRLEVSNTYSSFFRVTSLFRDPSLYGRHLVAGIAILLVALWLRKLSLVPAVLLIGFLWVGLYFSYSQSSMVSLFAVALAVTAAAGDRTAKLVALGIAVVLAAGAFAFLAAELRDSSARRVTSDRSRRVEVTLDVVRDRPIAGVGLGSQPAASEERSRRGGPDESFVSHTTPLTVAAELGLVGLALYLALLAGAARTIWLLWRRDASTGLALGAVLLALTIHSLFYSGFFEDPVTWLALGVASAALAAPRVVPLPATVEAEPRQELVEAS